MMAWRGFACLCATPSVSAPVAEEEQPAPCANLKLILHLYRALAAPLPSNSRPFGNRISNSQEFKQLGHRSDNISPGIFFFFRISTPQGGEKEKGVGDQPV
ncbi:hypothetical protein HOY82DRAFT_564056, partial [Tuber indicum]